MRLLIGRREGSSRRATPAAAPPPCRLHFLMFSALHAEKAALLRRKNAFGRTTAFLAPRMPSQNKKAIPYGMTFCFGGDKRDRTADLMTASCYRFVIWSVFASNTSVPSVKSAGFCSALRIASTRFRAAKMQSVLHQLRWLRAAPNLFWLRQNGRMRCSRRAFARKIWTVEPRSVSRAAHSPPTKKDIPFPAS